MAPRPARQPPGDPPWLLVLAMGLTVAVTGCGTVPDQKLSLSGSSTVAPLAAEIAKRYEARHPGIRVDVQAGGSSRGIADARSGTAQIGLVSRALKPQEADLQATTIAIDGIALIVNGANPVRSLSDDQVRAVYTGAITNWRQLGGADAAITVVTKAEGRSTLELFLEHFRLDNRRIKASVVIGDNQQGLLTVAGDPHALGYVSIGTASQEAKAGTAIRLLPLAGVAPSLENVRSGRYPLSRPLNLVIQPPVAAGVADFLAFARTPEVRDLVEAQFFVPPAR
ncbi:phosphate ABC transporter substrate-binding protein [Cyanobium gracile UHCC 0139]|uniref:Phosphate ABC transporter substrate-binding protein n=1 Tax=Cyanobium gracile UHCC 0139 TaxID=3110308 RepID=A0ABU5RQK1_9CYAN|nr:phosphate ABC transporter substrate-binding protein [Cyanobium gracile]MEA5390034.1 phosphate ABC transporter substrate-binding protein [Cyanobium gracile UHCC 0139]